jgi:DNA-directed RNA polymerase subunit RPC12/RpoP
MENKLIKYVCADCGKEPEKNKEMSNENWVVVENKPCIYCGGKLIIKLL